MGREYQFTAPTLQGILIAERLDPSKTAVATLRSFMSPGTGSDAPPNASHFPALCPN